MFSDIANVAGNFIGVGGYFPFEVVVWLWVCFSWILTKILKLCKKKKRKVSAGLYDTTEF